MEPTTTAPSPCACATFDDDEKWRALPLLRSMSARDLVPFITTRWSSRIIEVRRCPGCGRSIARVVPPRT